MVVIMRNKARHSSCVVLLPTIVKMFRIGVKISIPPSLHLCSSSSFSSPSSSPSSSWSLSDEAEWGGFLCFFWGEQTPTIYKKDCEKLRREPRVRGYYF